jgi:hypothetical protein
MKTIIIFKNGERSEHEEVYPSFDPDSKKFLCIDDSMEPITEEELIEDIEEVIWKAN